MMEKNETSQKDSLQDSGNQPGQQLPTTGPDDKRNDSATAAKSEQHSEESLPQADNETLGTP